ncbi:DNA helicase UvrD [Candidatus Woesearchaeota archaeon]|nr:DNA helicase UvrD [Candidatus Woesearchaeota archaeon]|tara:strand:- start:23616 stop:24878 length:1263 start_codon:yes stop_codon:yes gene_type:complete
MKIISDLHIHSKYARATSKALDLENLEKYARIKGVNLLGTGDFTHPQWIQEIKSNLKEDGSGILKSSNGFPFVLQTELALVYTQGGKGRRIHYLLYAPSLEIVKQITDFLLSKGRIDYDGRPIFGFSSIELVEKMNEISPDIEVIPAHIWTPFFGLLGSKTGFDSLKECFEEKTKLIHSIETGMSSDPEMNWRISALDNITLTSNSDLHSFWPWRMGREANVFEMDELNYKNILAAIRERKGFVETIEVDPGYGKYHFDGHRNCNVVMSPEESAKVNKICPACKKEMTIGVLNRVEELADREEGFKPEGAIPFKRLIPLTEIIVALNGGSLATKKTWAVYNLLIEKFGSEFNILLNVSEEELKKVVDEKLAAAIIANREGKIEVKPGYDGEYGIPILGKAVEEVKEEIKVKQQKGLGEFF